MNFIIILITFKASLVCNVLVLQSCSPTTAECAPSLTKLYYQFRNRAPKSKVTMLLLSETPNCGMSCLKWVTVSAPFKLTSLLLSQVSMTRQLPLKKGLFQITLVKKVALGSPPTSTCFIVTPSLLICCMCVKHFVTLFFKGDIKSPVILTPNKIFCCQKHVFLLMKWSGNNVPHSKMKGKMCGKGLD